MLGEFTCKLFAKIGPDRKSVFEGRYIHGIHR